MAAYGNNNKVIFNLTNLNDALAGVAQWIECWSENQRVTSLIPNQGTCLVCEPGPWWGMSERQPHTDVPLPLFKKEKKKKKKSE